MRQIWGPARERLIRQLCSNKVSTCLRQFLACIPAAFGQLSVYHAGSASQVLFSISRLPEVIAFKIIVHVSTDCKQASMLLDRHSANCCACSRTPSYCALEPALSSQMAACRDHAFTCKLLPSWSSQQADYSIKHTRFVLLNQGWACLSLLPAVFDRSCHKRL